MKYNPWLAEKQDQKGGLKYLEKYSPPELVPWQTRSHEPTNYEKELSLELMKIFSEEIYELPEIIERLNASKVNYPFGDKWNEFNFKSEVKRLGKWP